LDGIVDAIPAHETLLLEWTAGPLPSAQEVLEVLGEAQSPSVEGVAAAAIEIPVVYDGPDLESVATAAGISSEAVVRLHSSTLYTAAFCGFAPGFAYLTGLPRELQLPRLDSPRPNVPRGSVAIAGEYSGIYPSSSPGGWHLIASTQLRVFDPISSQPALIEPGATVRFVA
jgi:KipI family sensor histidine kinase inhibitor